jgi:hypothetical protein
MANMDFWYDAQIARYLTQMIRVFSHFRVREYVNGEEKLNRVPVRYGDSSRMVASILRNNSENTINSAPFMAVTINSLQLARDRAHDPMNVDTKQVAEREWDAVSRSYTSQQGNLYTTQRYMPVPYNLSIQLDIWTTNTDSKLQLLEQILVLFNPSIQLQSNTNPLDWTSVFEVELTDITWSSRSIPAGVDENLDITTLTFAVPIWLSPPAKVKRQSIIQKIIADIHTTSSIADLGFSQDYADFFGDVDKAATVVVTPGDFSVYISGADAQLLNSQGIPQAWSDLIEMQGKLTATSKLKLNVTNDLDNDLDAVVGSVDANPLDVTKLIFNLDQDTLPSSTLPNVDKIIDPRLNHPGDGVLLAASVGQRYLITHDISADGYPNWNLDAQQNDIIQYDGSNWGVAFESSIQTHPQYVTNTYTGKQYKWDNNSWISSYEGIYNPGFFTLIL